MSTAMSFILILLFILHLAFSAPSPALTPDEQALKSGNLRGSSSSGSTNGGSSISSSSSSASATISYPHEPVKEIPRIIFRTNEASSHKQLHTKFHYIYSQSLEKNPAYVQVYFSNAMRTAFIERYYPTYLSLYHKLIPGAYKADLFRLLAIYKYGGIYADSAINFIHSIEGKFIGDIRTDEFVGAVDLDNTAMLNGVFAAYPRHPIIGHMIKWVTNNIAHERYGCNDLDISGPKALGRAFHAYMNLTMTTALSLGQHEKNGFKYRFHQFHITQKVTNSKNEEIIRNKFDGYQEHQYHSQKPYGQIYAVRRVFKTPDMRDHRDVLTYNPNSNAYEGSLIRDGMRDEFWLVIHNTRYGFPSRSVFNNMGMDVCVFCSAGSNEVTKQIPFGGTLPSDSNGYWQKYWQALPSIDFNASPLMKAENSETSWGKLQEFISLYKKSTVDANVFIQFMDAEVGGPQLPLPISASSLIDGNNPGDSALHTKVINNLQAGKLRLQRAKESNSNPLQFQGSNNIERNDVFRSEQADRRQPVGEVSSLQTMQKSLPTHQMVLSKTVVGTHRERSEALLAHNNRRKKNDPSSNREKSYSGSRSRGNLVFQ